MAVSATGQGITISATQRKRSIAIALGLGALVVMFFVVTVVQMQGNVAKRMQQEGKATRSVVVPQSEGATGAQ